MFNSKRYTPLSQLRIFEFQEVVELIHKLRSLPGLNLIMQVVSTHISPLSKYHKVVISLCLSVCRFIDHNSGTVGPISSNFDWGTRESQGNVLSLF